MRVIYSDVRDPAVSSTRASLLNEIETKGLLYPVTAIEGVPVYDGAVSYQGIITSVRERMERLHS